MKILLSLSVFSFFLISLANAQSLNLPQKQSHPRMVAPAKTAPMQKHQLKIQNKASIPAQKADISVRYMSVTPSNIIELSAPGQEARVTVSCGFENIGKSDSGPVEMKVHFDYFPQTPYRFKREMIRTVENIPAESFTQYSHLGKDYQIVDGETHIAGTNVIIPYKVTCSAKPLTHEIGSLAENNKQTKTVSVKRTY